MPWGHIVSLLQRVKDPDIREWYIRRSLEHGWSGLLLCREKNRLVVEYALRDLKKPIGVAKWETQIVKSLPTRFDGILPTVEEIEPELAGTEGREGSQGDAQ